MGWETLNLAELVGRILLTCCLLLSSANQLTPIDGTVVDKTFKKSTSLFLGTNRLSSPWSSSSLVVCVTRCLADYATSCKSVVYHADLQLCTPGSQASLSLPVPDAATEGDLYSREQTCDTNTGFTLVSGYGIQACFKLLNHQDYLKHQMECSSLGGFLASVRTADKLALTRDFLDGSTAYIGLDDLVTEGTFVWHDTGLPITASEKSELFSPGEPNNHNGNEDCAYHYPASKMNDIPCTSWAPALCETFMN